jgi:long-chain acyl-CoA synthetase
VANAWAFDLDGCLVDALSATSVRPLVPEVLAHLRAAAIPVVVWSAGGADYARRVLTRAGVDHLVDGYYDKVRGPDGRWRFDAFAADHRPVTCVDDDPAGVPDGVRVVPVPPYLSANPHNRGFEAAWDAARAY